MFKFVSKWLLMHVPFKLSITINWRCNWNDKKKQIRSNSIFIFKLLTNKLYSLAPWAKYLFQHSKHRIFHQNMLHTKFKNIALLQIFIWVHLVDKTSEVFNSHPLLLPLRFSIIFSVIQKINLPSAIRNWLTLCFK